MIFSISVVRFRPRILGGLFLVAAAARERVEDQIGLEAVDRGAEVALAARAVLALGSGGGRPAQRLGQVVDVQISAAAQHGDPLHQVLELAHVARPVVAAQDLERGVGDRLDLGAALLVQHLEEVHHEQRDVLAPLAQRRHLDRDHVEPVEEVLAEAPVADRRRRDPGWWRRSRARSPSRTSRSRPARTCAPGARAGASPGGSDSCRRSRPGRSCRRWRARSGPRAS